MTHTDTVTASATGLVTTVTVTVTDSADTHRVSKLDRTSKGDRTVRSVRTGVGISKGRKCCDLLNDVGYLPTIDTMHL